MKRNRYIAIWLLCCIAMLLAGCSRPAEPELPEPNFEAGEKHSNAEAFRFWFDTMSSTAGPCTVSVQEKIYDEERASAWWYAIQSDLSVLTRTLGLEEDAYTPFTIYIVERTLNGIQVWENSLYCTPADISSGAYREGLVGAVLSAESWKRFGLADSLFSPEKADSAQLAAYLTDAEDVDILGLYAPYFVDAFAGEEELAMARLAARLLCEHVITAHGGTMLMENSCIGCRQELLDELGVDRAYADPYGDFDRGFRYLFDSGEPLVVKTPRGDTFHLQPLTYDMSTSAEVCRFLYIACYGPQVILEAVKADAPEYAEIFAQNYSDPITFYASPDGEANYTNTYTREIHLVNVSSVIHEMTHIMVPCPYIVADQWKYEACANYFDYTYYPYAGIRYIYDLCFSDPAGPREDPEYYMDLIGMYEVDQKAVEIYLAHASFSQTADEVDTMLFVKARMAVYRLLSPPDGALVTLNEAYRMTQHASILSPGGGNELTYPEAALFADHLVQKYSLSTFLDFCFDTDAEFEAVFGTDYETAEAEWLEDLMRMAEA